MYNSLKGAVVCDVLQYCKRLAKLLKEVAKDGIPGLKAAYAEEGFYIGADQLDALISIKSKNEVIADVIAFVAITCEKRSALQSGGNTIHGVLKLLVIDNSKQNRI